MNGPGALAMPAADRPGRRPSRRVVLVACAALCGSSAARADDDASAHVGSSQGTLPLILTVPHDGAEFIGLVPVRSKGALLRDAGTRELAQRVAALLEQRLGQRPSLVIARFSRKYLDANRAQADAMESTDALAAYRADHDRIASFVAELRREFPQGALLVDVHGQSDSPDTTFRGTRAGLTAKALLRRFGPAALQGEHSLIGVLAARGYAVDPAIGSDSLREDPRFAGGHTVFTHGSQRSDGIDAIQLEFGKSHRANPRLAEDFAEALVVFMTKHGLLSS